MDDIRIEDHGPDRYRLAFRAGPFHNHITLAFPDLELLQARVNAAVQHIQQRRLRTAPTVVPHPATTPAPAHQYPPLTPAQQPPGHP
ncbi:hypothetical protein C3Y87_19005 [Carbonactinospora thermoautotrophica]|uniref:hypothetical protein n=1 Tax=Carbonactinospora thermoautotrophica TaxID=1469144 RepID=UPI00226D5489|nr:hypothetical protein [Carbonactinospora thermoautotrophica]MCX9193446.1 hypothetical protein [Carbonactinospora thermoautotrophica]